MATEDNKNDRATNDVTLPNEANEFRSNDDSTNVNIFPLKIPPEIKNPFKPDSDNHPLPHGPLDFTPEGNLPSIPVQPEPTLPKSDGKTLDQMFPESGKPMSPEEIEDLLKDPGENGSGKNPYDGDESDDGSYDGDDSSKDKEGDGKA